MVAKVLAAHERTWAGSRCCWTCSCRTWEGDTTDDHRAHVAAEVTNALTTTLTRMADEWDQRATTGIHRDDFNSALLTWGLAAKELRAAIPEALGAGEVSQ